MNYPLAAYEAFTVPLAMQPHAPQLPVDDSASPTAKNWKKRVLLPLVLVALVAALIAFLLPQKQVEGQNAPSPAQHRAKSPAYGDPVR